MYNEFKRALYADLNRYTKDEKTSYIKKLHYYLRGAHYTKNKLLQLYFRYRLKSIREKHGLEISYTCEIGDGIYFGHPYNITINEDAVLGKNINIHKGVTIGQENRGPRKGAPIIGDRVWIGINSVIVGKIVIGDNVLIAPNTFVNCDIPRNSVVFGNPCVIKPSEYATEGYINRTVN